MIELATSLELPKPSHWPTPMVRFGINPESDPMYRVVFAPTVMKLVFGCFSDGYVGARARPSYPQIGSKWIMEKWISGYEDTKMTPADYERWGPRDPESGMLINGPYPYKGTYNHCWTFDAIADISGIEHIIRMIEQGAKRTFAEVQQGNRELDAKAEKDAAANRFLRVRETEPLYGVRPANFAGAPKSVNHKSQRLPVAANNLGLPVKRGSVVAMRGPKVNASI
jgi:hypothetical protein